MLLVNVCLVFFVSSLLIPLTCCFSGSGELDLCDLTVCNGPTERNEVLEHSPTTVSIDNSLDCSLDCTNNINPADCNLCTFSETVFPDSPIYLLYIPESHAIEGVVQLNISGLSEMFFVKQQSRVVVIGTGFFIPFDVTSFSCSELLVKYQVGDTLAETTVCLDYGPSSPDEISYKFNSICDTENTNKASITIQWNNTNSFSFWLFQYNVTLYGSNGFSKTAFIDTNDSSITISDGPLLNKEYSLTITPYPGDSSNTIQSLNTNLPDTRVDHDCTINFDSLTLKYSFLYTWIIHNNDCSIVNNIIQFQLNFASYENKNANGFYPDETRFGTKIIQPTSSSNYSYEFTNLSYLQNGKYDVKFNTIYKDASLQQNPSQFLNVCFKSVIPSPPTIVKEINITNFTRFDDDRISCTIIWSSPEYINGHNLTYSLWIGTEELQSSSDELPTGSTLNKEILYQKNINGSQNHLLIEEVRTFSAPVLYIQVISTNEFCTQVTPPCNSNWSQPLIYSVPVESVTVSVSSSSTLMTNSEIVVSVTMEVPNSPSISQQIIWPLTGVIAGLFLLVITMTTIVVCCCCFGGRIIKRHIPMDPMINMNDPANFDFETKQLDILYPPFKCLELEEWEIPRNLLDVFEKEILGSGCFGEVCKGSLQMDYVHKKRRLNHQHKIHQKVIKYKDGLPVAVKKLKKTADGKERADFLKEIDTMIRVAETESELKRFVVNTLGCCRLHEPILLVVEYVSCGDLLHYLRAEKKKMQQGTALDSNIPVPYLEPVNEYSHLEPMSQVIDLQGNLTSKNLIDFSRQIAAGMEFLNGLDIIHRDLACRNILVSSDRALKISDFGLARTVPQDEVYTLTNHGRLPIRWMALESIFQREFTAASDVWSYGVVLWEICTMGKFPYAALTEKELLRLLKKGHRLEQPDNCSKEIYEVMHQCWHPNPSGRPKFSDLHRLFDNYLTKHTQDQYPYIDMDSNTVYTFDHLTPKSLSDYQTHMKEILKLEEIRDENGGSGEKDYDNTGNEHNLLQEPLIYIDNKFNESSSNNHDSDSGALTQLGTHAGLYRLFDGNRNTSQTSYDHLTTQEDMYDKEVLDTLNSIYMIDNAVDEDYDELWRKKLSTITEASNEDYQM